MDDSLFQLAASVSRAQAGLCQGDDPASMLLWMREGLVAPDRKSEVEPDD